MTKPWCRVLVLHSCWGFKVHRETGLALRELPWGWEHEAGQNSFKNTAPLRRAWRRSCLCLEESWKEVEREGIWGLGAHVQSSQWLLGQLASNGQCSKG